MFKISNERLNFTIIHNSCSVMSYYLINGLSIIFCAESRIFHFRWSTMKVGILGGGVSGLGAAHYLLKNKKVTRIAVFEASKRYLR